MENLKDQEKKIEQNCRDLIAFLKTDESLSKKIEFLIQVTNKIREVKNDE